MAITEQLFQQQYIKEFYKNACYQYETLAIYGAGKHTETLLKILDTLTGKELLCVFDDTPSKQNINDIPVLKTDKIPSINPGAIILSSDMHEDKMKLNLESKFPGLPLLPLYSSLGKGPFTNDISGNKVTNFQRNRSLLSGYKDIHKGERCFIIGNGPSLNRTDLSLLKNEFTIGMNRFYLAFEDLGFQTTYYIAINDLVLEQSGKEICNSVNSPKFFSSRHPEYITKTNETFLLDTVQGPAFSRDLTLGIWEGATVTYAAMQVAFYLGFNEVILIGVDHSFVTKGEPHKEVVSTGDDPNHFNKKYFGKGYRWHLPDLETSELAYQIAQYAFRSAKRSITDATVGGHLNVFPKVDYPSLFDK